MNTTTKGHSPSSPIGRKVGELCSIIDQITGYRLMIPIADRYGNAYEVERMTEAMAEAEGEAEYVREALIDLGWEGPA